MKVAIEVRQMGANGSNSVYTRGRVLREIRKRTLVHVAFGVHSGSEIVSREIDAVHIGRAWYAIERWTKGDGTIVGLPSITLRAETALPADLVPCLPGGA